jgi:hypothetical protein
MTPPPPPVGGVVVGGVLVGGCTTGAATGPQPSLSGSLPSEAGTDGQRSRVFGTPSLSLSASVAALAGQPSELPPLPRAAEGHLSAESLTPSPSKSAVDVAGAVPVRI